MWNIREIKEKQRYVIERLKRVTDKKEKERLELSLLAYYSILNDENIRYTKIYNFIDRLTKHKYTLKKEQEYGMIYQKLFIQEAPYLDADYINFLIKIATNVSRDNGTENIESKNIKTTENELINISKSFYTNLGNKEIIKIVNSILSDKNSINFSKKERKDYEEWKGITFEDYAFNKTYHDVTIDNDIFDYQAFNHEIMHGIDFRMNQKLPSESYYGFHEVPTYTIDYLFIDFLDNIGFDKEEVEKLKIQKEQYIQDLAGITLIDLKYETKNSNSISFQTLNNLLEVKSGVIAYIFYNQIKENKEYGLNNLINFMRNNIPKDKRPNFSYLGITDELILENSNLIGEYSNQTKRNR